MPAASPDARPLLFHTSALAQVAWAMQFLTPDGKAFAVRDAPALPTDRCLRFHTGGLGVHIEVAVPLASAPTAREPRAMKGGCFDPAKLAAFDGLDAATSTTQVEATSRGLRITIGSERPFVVAAMKGLGDAALGFVPPPLPDDLPKVEEAYESFAEKLGARLDAAKVAKGESGIAVLAVLTRLRPQTITVRKHEAYAEASGQHDGVVTTVTFPAEILP